MSRVRKAECRCARECHGRNHGSVCQDRTNNWTTEAAGLGRLNEQAQGLESGVRRADYSSEFNCTGASVRLPRSRRLVEADSSEQAPEVDKVSARPGFRLAGDRSASPDRRRNAAVALTASTLFALLVAVSLVPTLLGGAAPSPQSSAPVGDPVAMASAVTTAATAEDSPTQDVPTEEPSTTWTLEPDPSDNHGPHSGDDSGDFEMFVGTADVAGHAWGDRARIGVNAPAGATCSVALKFPTGVVLDLGTHTLTEAESKWYYWIWWTVPESAGRGWVQGRAWCVLGDKRAGGDWGYFYFAINGGVHQPEGWWIQMYDDGFTVVAGTRANIRAWVAGPQPSGFDVNYCSAVIHLAGGIDVPIDRWLSTGVDTSIRWFAVPADTAAGPGDYDVTCSSPNETKVAHGNFIVSGPDASPEPTPAPTAELTPTPEVPTTPPPGDTTPPPSDTPTPPTADPGRQTESHPPYGSLEKKSQSRSVVTLLQSWPPESSRKKRIEAAQPDQSIW
jgi:hypothetical protein